MSSLTDRLRGVLKPNADAGQDASPPHESAGLPALDAAAEVLGGDWSGTDGHRFLIVDRTYAPGHRHGRVALADGLPPSTGAWPRLSLLAGAASAERPVFVDLETTGLAGGAGTYAFLIGCGWFDAGRFRVRQFFLAEYAAERGLLQALAEVAARAGTVVTYNGKSFDLPLIETRFTLHRMDAPFAGLPHVDMLHPARRLWRADDGETVTGQSSCRLCTIEQTLCGHVRDGDVPGFEIPGRYFRYVRHGDARPLAAVLEHNRLDLLSLAMLTARAAQLLDDGPGATSSAREALGLGRLYERGGLLANARAAYLRAARLDQGLTIQAEALRAYAVVCRRQHLYAEAAGAWKQLLVLRRCPLHFVREATEALAVHHEHRVRDLLAARTFALRSLEVDGSTAQRHALQHRLARLDRKLVSAAEYEAQHPRLWA